MKKTAFITGVNGQLGSYLAEILIEKGYNVIGVIRRSCSSSYWRLNNIIHHHNFILTEGDITDAFSISHLLFKYKPDEIYNLASQSHVYTSFSQPKLTWDSTAQGTLNILEAARQYSNYGNDVKVMQASSSEQFGKSFTEKINPMYFCKEKNKIIYKDFLSNKITEEQFCRFQDLDTSFTPCSPYSIAKLAAHNATILYKDTYNMYCVPVLMFNNESPRRGVNFVTRKITKWLYHFKYNKNKNKLKLGNLDAIRDWGYSKEYAYGIYLTLQQDNPETYLFATGESHTVREFLDKAIEYFRVDPSEVWNYIEIDKTMFRPNEVPYLRGYSLPSQDKLNWAPKTTFNELVRIMVEQENGQD